MFQGFAENNQEKAYPTTYKIFAFCALFMVGPGSFLLFVSPYGQERAWIEASVWFGAFGCVGVGVVYSVTRFWGWLCQK